MRRVRTESGFSLIELMVATAVAAFVVAGMLVLAEGTFTAVHSHREHQMGERVSNVLVDAVAGDLRHVGLGVSFYAGAPNGAFSVATGRRGFPTLQPADDITDDDVMPGSDAVMLLRVEGPETHLAHFTGQRIRGAIGNIFETFRVDDATRLARCQDGTGAQQAGLVLVASHDRGAGSSMLLPLRPFDPAPNAATRIMFGTQFGIDPTDTDRVAAGAGGPLIDPMGAGPGSTITCVRPISYWLDRQGRLRMWRSTASSPSGAKALNGTFGSVRADPDNDAVVASGLVDLQFAYRMSGSSAEAPNAWAFGGGGVVLTVLTNIAEIRRVRIAAVIRTPHVGAGRSDNVSRQRPANLFNRNNAGLAPQRGCQTPTACYDPDILRRDIRTEVNLVQLQILDQRIGPVATAAFRAFMR